MQQYKDLIKDILENGLDSDDRTGTGTLSLFGKQLRFDLQKGFPAVTLKKMWWKGVVIELMWLLRGETNIQFLVDRGIHIWDQWADKNGDLGPIYGKQWRQWEAHEVHNEGHPRFEFTSKSYIDQIKQVIERIKTNPDCRRLIVSAWNVADVNTMKLPPCHCFFQFYVRGGRLSCQLYQRSADVFLGVPFNIASYALLTHLVANECGLEVGEFIHTFGDIHLYKNHIEQARELVSRDCKKLPELQLNLGDVDLMNWIDLRTPGLTWTDLNDRMKLIGYESHPAIKADVSV